jgi:hypothetical protein
MLTRYLKTVLSLIPLVTLLVQQLVQALTDGGADGSLSTSEVVLAVAGLVTPVLVYLGRNTTTNPNVAATESVTLVSRDGLPR